MKIHGVKFNPFVERANRSWLTNNNPTTQETKMKEINTDEEWLAAIKQLESYSDWCKESDDLTNLIVDYEMRCGLIPSPHDMLEDMEDEYLEDM
jgi:hypothetical protein